MNDKVNQAFVGLMQYKLDKHKDWSPGNITVEQMFSKLVGEVFELHAALFERPYLTREIAEECADIANYAMFIAQAEVCR